MKQCKRCKIFCSHTWTELCFACARQPHPVDGYFTSTYDLGDLHTNGPPFKEDRTEFCDVCKQHYACANCTAEQCNDQGDEMVDDDRPRDMGRLDWDVLDWSAWQNERRL